MKSYNIRTFKLIEGKKESTTFLPLNTNIGGQSRPIKDKNTKYLTDNQTKYVCKEVKRVV